MPPNKECIVGYVLTVEVCGSTQNTSSKTSSVSVCFLFVQTEERIKIVSRVNQQHAADDVDLAKLFLNPEHSVKPPEALWLYTRTSQA